MGHPHPSSFIDEQFNTLIMKPSQCKQFWLLLPEQHTFRHETVTHTQRPNSIPPKDTNTWHDHFKSGKRSTMFNFPKSWQKDLPTLQR